MSKDSEQKRKNTTSKTKEKNKKESKITKANTKKEEKEIKKTIDLEEEVESDYDEDLDFDYEEEDNYEEEQEEQEEQKPEKNSKKDKEDKKAKEKIEKIERIAKEKKKKVKTNSNSKIKDILLYLDTNRKTIYGFIAGMLLTILVAFFVWPDRIATLKDGTQPVVKVDKKTYTANDLYEDMKDHYSVSLLLDEIDNDLLTKLYKEDDTMLTKVKSDAENYINSYKQYYNYTEEEFLSKNGFANYNEFLDYLKLDYRRTKYLDDYLKKNLTDKEIQKYYDDKVFGDINTQHVLVSVSTSENDKKLSDEDAKKLAEEIIGKINDGTKWEDIKKEYKDKITFEDLGYQSWDASLEESFMTALKSMKDNSYSEEPVKTSYGYHVIYRLDQKKKPTLKKSKSKIIENLIADKKKADSKLQNKALISLRKEKNIKFSDTVMETKYNNYCKEYK